MRDIRIEDVSVLAALEQHYDLAFWAAGYESRSAWLVRSEFRPKSVEQWWKLEFEEHRDLLSGADSRTVDCGALMGGRPSRQNHDGEWVLLWRTVIDDAFRSADRPINVFVDYSSMPRAAYGALVVETIRQLRPKIKSITFAYVPGVHSDDIDGSRGIKGLRSLIGTEGESRFQRAAFLLGLGYDGTLSETVVELFQASHFSTLYASPGATTDAVARVIAANMSILERAELIGTAPAWSIREAMDQYQRLADWYSGYRDVMVVPLGPKPHVLAGILMCAFKPMMGFRFPETTRVRPVEVTVPAGTIPYFASLTL
jgi:hypothetical protein